MENFDGDKLYIIPQEIKTKEHLLRVDRDTKEMLRLKHRFYVMQDWECNTIATTTIEMVVRLLYTHIKECGLQVLDEEDSKIDFYQLLVVDASNRKAERAEKTGNINAKFRPGKLVESIIADDVPVEQRLQVVEFIAADAAYSYEDAELTKVMMHVDKYARNLLADKYSILLPKDFQAVATTVIFLENLYRELVKILTLTDKKKATINFNDIIEFHAEKKDDKCLITLRPGMGAKLIIKSDERTEDEELGD